MHVVYSMSYNNMTYIGQTDNIAKRLACHKTRSKTHTNKLYTAMRKYGFEKFKFEPLVLCSTKAEADIHEQLNIAAFGNLNTIHRK